MIHHFIPSEALTLIEPKDLGLEFTSVQRIELSGKSIVYSKTEELCLLVCKGSVLYTHEEVKTENATTCDILYLPREDSLILEGQNSVVMRFGAPCDRKTSFAHIRFSEVDNDDRHKHYGNKEQGTSRDVWNMIDESFDSSRFLVGICYGSQGGWTAWPPHEHGEKREETYCYFNMDDGFAIQCVYDEIDQKDSSVIVQEGHIISIPTGYHPNVGCPKTGIKYVYCMVSRVPDDRNFMDLHIQQNFGNRLE